MLNHLTASSALLQLATRVDDRQVKDCESMSRISALCVGGCEAAKLAMSAGETKSRKDT